MSKLFSNLSASPSCSSSASSSTSSSPSEGLPSFKYIGYLEQFEDLNCDLCGKKIGKVYAFDLNEVDFLCGECFDIVRKLKKLKI